MFPELFPAFTVAGREVVTLEGLVVVDWKTFPELFPAFTVASREVVMIDGLVVVD